MLIYQMTTKSGNNFVHLYLHLFQLCLFDKPNTHIYRYVLKPVQLKKFKKSQQYIYVIFPFLLLVAFNKLYSIKRNEKGFKTMYVITFSCSHTKSTKANAASSWCHAKYIFRQRLRVLMERWRQTIYRRASLLRVTSWYFILKQKSFYAK